MVVVGYTRFSSDAQRDGFSIEAQVRAIKDYCKRMNFDLKKVYIDEACTGTNDDRDEFQQMIKDSNDKGFQGVVVHKFDRFARDKYDSVIYKKKLRDNGVTVFSVLEPLDDSPESIIMESLLEGMAEYFSRNLSREVRKGKGEAALQARHNGGVIPYGFTVDADMHYLPIPDEAAVVREIFRRLDGGQSMSAVLKWTVLQGYKTRRGSYFNQSFLRSMVQNTSYIGRYTYGTRTKTGNPPTVFEDAFPAIVDSTVFWRVNDRIASRRYGPRQKLKEDDYLLTGYLYCAYCGSHLFGFKSKQTYKTKEGTNREYIFRRYRCAKKYDTQKHRRFEPDHTPDHCVLKAINKDELEVFVIESIKARIFGDETLDWVVEQLGKKIAERASRADDVSVVALTEEIKKLTMQKERLLDLYLDGTLMKDAYNKKADELSSRLDFLNSKLRSIVPKTVSIDPAKIKAAVRAYNESANGDSVEYKKRLLSTFVDSIAVSNETIVIYYKLPIPGFNSSEESFVRKDNHSLTYFTIRTEFPISAIAALDFRAISCSIQQMGCSSAC